jgi:cbb3-type cytochrome oxidase maturation protein
MEVLVVLIPVSIGLGALGLGAFFWTMKSSQYDDPDGDAARILRDDYDDAPKG